MTWLTRKSKILKRLLVLTATLVVLVGCSRITLLYENGSWMTTRWAAGLLDADSAQKEAWQKHFDEIFARHQQQLLPEVISLLAAAEEQVRNGVDDRQLACLFTSADHTYRRHAALFVPAAVTVLRSATPHQIAHLREELADRNRDYRDEMIFDDPDRQLKARVERYQERIEDWTGDLSPAQQRMIRREVSALPDIAAVWLDYREERQAQLIALLQQQAGDDLLERHLTAWWIDFAQRPPELVLANQALRAGMRQLLASIDNTLSKEQRTAVINRLRDWRIGLESVSPEAKAIAHNRATEDICSWVKAA